jgi:trehalose 2-sulfotransferase
MDFCRRSSAADTTTLLICGMPRSGTTFLAGLLASTGFVAVAREYFNGEDPEPAGIDYPAFVARVVADRTKLGVFAAKFINDQLWDFLAALRSYGRNGGLSDRELVEQALPRPCFVWLRRRDDVAEAVSWSKALQTGEWWSDGRELPQSPIPKPVFDVHEIARCIDELAQGNERWEQWFVDNKIEPVRVVYEELEADRDTVTRRVLALLDVALPDNLQIAERSARQSDAVNREWIARYHALQGAASRHSGT